MSLTGVWIHREDLDMSTVNMPENEHENLYLCKHEKDMRKDLKDAFGEACEAENSRLNNIKRLIKAHL